MKTINLDKILGSELFSEIYRGCSMSDTTYNVILKAMKEACRQTLELAAENTNLTVEYVDSEITSQEHNVTIFDELGDLKQVIYTNKQSILNTINQIK